jgi:hypothetical protein
VGPRYNAKYQTAAENALHNCYRNSLQVARETGIRSVALSVVNSQRKGYPPETGAHIALRTIRRFVEHYRDSFDTLLLAMVDGAVDYSVYRRLLPLYFPRTAAEFNTARSQLPADCGNEYVMLAFVLLLLLLGVVLMFGFEKVSVGVKCLC